MRPADWKILDGYVPWQQYYSNIKTTIFIYCMTIVADLINSFEKYLKTLFKWLDENFSKTNSDKKKPVLGANINGYVISNKVEIL